MTLIVDLYYPHHLLLFSLHNSTNATFNYANLFFFYFRNATCNGIALWVKWILYDDITINTGPVEEVVVGEKVIWDMYSKQGVYFFKNIENITLKNRLLYNIKFHVENAMFEYNFKIV